jgi:hypothetical protein
MSTDDHDLHDQPVGRGTGYEPRDAKPTPVIVTGLAMLVMMLGGFAGASWFFGVFKELEVAERPAPSPLYERQVPSGALLQGHPDEELKAYMKSQVEFLHSYGWVDTQLGIVHIPVHRAMERVVAQGVPRWDEPESEPPPPEEEPTSAP